MNIKPITNYNQCWEGNDISIPSVTVSLSKKSIDLMKSFVEEKFDLFNENFLGEEDFRLLAMKLDSINNEINLFKSKYLDNGHGILIIKNILPIEYTDINNMQVRGEFIIGNKRTNWIDHKKKLKVALAVISHNLGELQVQAEEDDEDKVERLVYVKEIKDRGMSYGAGSKAHYSDTSQGGDYHTDGAERPLPVPKYLPLLCIRQSEIGGETIIKSIYPSHNRLLKKSPIELQRLYNNFTWDRRGSQDENESVTFEKPIFSINGSDGLIFSYLREYIESGYLISKKQMISKDLAALDAIDKEISDEKLYLSIKLNPGNLLVSNNFFTIHGRPKTGFKDSKMDYRKKRLMIRTWVASIN